MRALRILYQVRASHSENLRYLCMDIKSHLVDISRSSTGHSLSDDHHLLGTKLIDEAIEIANVPCMTLFQELQSVLLQRNPKVSVES
jgi:hypothetical protein